MLNEPSNASYVPASHGVNRTQTLGDSVHSNDRHNLASFHQNRHFSFSTNASEETSGLVDSFSGLDQGSFFVDADHGEYGTGLEDSFLNNNYEYDGN